MYAIKTSLFLNLLIFTVGIAWCGPLYHLFRREAAGRTRYVAAGAAVILAGLPTILTAAFMLGELGLFRSPYLETTLTLLVLSGAGATGLLKVPGNLREKVRDSLPAAVFFFIAIGSLLAISHRGEWVLGGWDPGVYLNEGVALDRQGTLHPDDTVFMEIDSNGKEAFTRTLHGRTERFPGIVTESKRGTFSFEFFRLTPAMIAVGHRLGGLRTALRTNLLLAFTSAFLLAFLLLQTTGGVHAVMAAILLASQPIFLYHTHVPVSEMLHLTLLLGAGILISHRHRSIFANSFLSFILFLLVLNRFSFLPFAGLLIIIIAWDDRTRSYRRRVFLERVLQVGSVVFAAFIDLEVAPASLRGWGPFSKLVAVFVISILAASLLDSLCTASSIRRRITRAIDVMQVPIIICCTAALCTLVLFGIFFGSPKDSDNLLRFVYYIGPLPVVTAIIGAVLFFFWRRKTVGLLKIFVLFLLVVTALLLMEKWIVDIYPWATRRYLPYSVPAVAILASYPLSLLWRRRGAPRVLSAVLLLVVSASVLPQAWRAWSNTEYDGVLEVLDKVSAQIKPEDIVIADSPRWGTPLTFLHGREVLDGKHLWRFKREEDIAGARQAVDELRAGGKSVRFLTSTEAGIGIYPFYPGPLRVDWESGPFTLEEIAHSPRGTGFPLRKREYQLRLFSFGE